MALSFEEAIQKANPYHDPKTGRFTTAPGGSASKYSAEDMDKLKSAIERGAIFSAINQRKAMGMSEEEFNEIKNTIKPPKKVEKKPKKERPEGLSNKPTQQEKPAEDDYRMQHRPNRMGSGHDITDADAMPKDFYDHPEWYAPMHEQSYKESLRVLRAIRNKPDAEVTIYRAAPKNEFNDGDWVTLSRTYAQTHASRESNDNRQLQVYSKKVKAKDIQFAGDDINEFGYFPVDGVSKSFADTIQKYNKWHDPRTGRFTSAPAGASGDGALMELEDKGVVIDGIEVPELIVNSEIPGVVDTYVATMKRKIAQDEIKSVLNNKRAEVNLSGMDPDLALETADTVKRTVEKYPMLKDAIKGIKTYWSEENAFAQYDPESRKIELNRKYYEDKSVLVDKTNESLNLKWHPEGTDYNSNIVHEMGHALDFYASEILYGEERVVFGHGTASRKIWREDKNNSEKAGHRITGEDIRDGLSGYAASSPHEYFAEAFAEVTCSPNPRPMAKGIWEKFEVYMNEAQEKERNGESRVGKSFSAVIQKFNPYHDPKTGRFTSAQGGSGGMSYSKVIDGVEVPDHVLAEGDDSVQEFVQLVQSVKQSKADYEQKSAVLKEALPNTKMNSSILSIDDEVFTGVAETAKKMTDKYPMIKDALREFVVDETTEQGGAYDAYDRGYQKLILYKSHFGDKNTLESAYKRDLEHKYHPAGTDHNAIIAHELAHALDFYMSTKKNRDMSGEIMKTVAMQYQRSGKQWNGQTIMDELSAYATKDSREFFAEAISEYVMSPNPRPMAKIVGQQVDRMVQYL